MYINYRRYDIRLVGGVHIYNDALTDGLRLIAEKIVLSMLVTVYHYTSPVSVIINGLRL